MVPSNHFRVIFEYNLFVWRGLVSGLNAHHNKRSKRSPSSQPHTSQRRRIEPLMVTSVYSDS
jgi:hypothetical protein